VSSEVLELQSNEEIAENEISIEELERILHESGVSTEGWGTEEAKTIELLLEEVNSGETILEKVGGVLIRKTRVARSRIYYLEGDDAVHRLSEDRQVFKSDGRTRSKKFEQAVGEKIRINEDPDEAMIRGIHEELAIDGEIDFRPKGIHFEKGPSYSYPGLTTEQTMYDFEAILNDNQYNPNGYIEEGETLTTYFIWKEISELDLPHD